MTTEANNNEIVILGAARTPIGRLAGALSGLAAPELGAIAVKAAVERSGIDPATVYEALIGQVVAAGAGQAAARHAALGGGLPDTVGATAVNKACGSGLKAVMLAANSIVAGEADVFVAGGMESMSNAPYLLPGARSGMRFGHGTVEDSLLKDGLWCAFEGWAMGNAADFIAREYDVSREQMDTFAFESHRRAAEATVAGKFDDETVPVEVRDRKGKVTVVRRDEPIRATFDDNGYQLLTSVESLGKLRPAFEKDGRVTAGNAPGLNDGSAAVVLSSAAEARRQGLQPMARIVGYNHAALAPKYLFAAPAKAIPQLLNRVGWTLDDVDLIELNEAFAAQVLANGADMAQNGMELDWSKVNVNGGAIALGHPIGASGTRILVTLLYALKQRGGTRGIASLCLGGGEAVALAVELL